jgi:hypothetical protein
MNRLLRTIPAVLAVGVMWTSPATGTNQTDRATIPAELQVPAGHERVLQAVGRGVQIYDCADGTWKFREPEATIFDNQNGEQIATHDAGPSWESTRDGSTVAAAVKARHDAPDARDDIPWLLLEATNNAGPGVFAEVASIHRLDTVGGAAPSGTCVTGQTTRVPYRATYDFWAPSS